MELFTQTVQPKIIFKDFSGNKYLELSSSSNDISGKNLLSYNFQKSVNQFAGQFSLQLKEDTEIKAEFGDKTVLDSVSPLDIIEIYEDSDKKASFIGVVLNIGYSASAGDLTRVINISGKGIEYLFEYLTIALDVTAMAWAKDITNIDAKNIELKATTNGGKGCARIQDVVYNAYKAFRDTANKHDKLSNNRLCGIIDDFYKNKGDNFNFLESTDISFKYPITSNLFKNSVINITSYFKNLFPEAVYEFYGTIVNGEPKIRIREKPFNADKWQNLKAKTLEPVEVINYSLSRSINEVYTVFYSYVEGSSLSPDFYNKLYATSSGYANAAISDKQKLYGYKPLQCNFVGFNIAEKDDKGVQSDINSKFLKLNEEMKTWYENLDDMFEAQISCIQISGKTQGNIGEKLKFMNGEFYITGTDHSWSYGGMPKITYHCERGGQYNNGVFSKLKGVSKPLAEFNNGN